MKFYVERVQRRLRAGIWTNGVLSGQNSTDPTVRRLQASICRYTRVRADPLMA